MNSSQQLQHLYWRAGFGPRPQDVAAGLSPRKALRQLLHDSEKYEPLVGPGLSYIDPQGVVMTDPASIKNNPVPNGMVATPDQPALPGAPAVAAPEGTYYVFADFTRFLAADMPPEAASAQLVRQLAAAGVEVVDGATCGAPGCVRLSYAVPTNDLRLALAQVRSALLPVAV